MQNEVRIVAGYRTGRLIHQVDLVMRNFPFLLLSLILLASCNVVVTSPNQPEQNVYVDAVTGRWQSEKGADAESEGDFLLVSKAAKAVRYRADIYEDGVKDDSPLFSLSPGRHQGEYWGFAVSEVNRNGEFIFHLILSGDRAEFRWLDSDSTESLLDDAGLAYEKQTGDGIFKWSIVQIRATRTELLNALNQGGESVLASDLSVFRRMSPRTEAFQQ